MHARAYPGGFPGGLFAVGSERNACGHPTGTSPDQPPPRLGSPVPRRDERSSHCRGRGARPCSTRSRGGTAGCRSVLCCRRRSGLPAARSLPGHEMQARALSTPRSVACRTASWAASEPSVPTTIERGMRSSAVRGRCDVTCRARQSGCVNRNDPPDLREATPVGFQPGEGQCSRERVDRDAQGLAQPMGLPWTPVLPVTDRGTRGRLRDVGERDPDCLRPSGQGPRVV
jgi:hypothetical protein